MGIISSLWNIKIATMHDDSSYRVSAGRVNVDFNFNNNYTYDLINFKRSKFRFVRILNLSVQSI